MKLEVIQLANPVQIGSSLEKHFTSHGGQGRIAYDLTLDGNIVHIQKKDKPEEVGFTTVFNMIGGKVESHKEGMGANAGNNLKGFKATSKKD